MLPFFSVALFLGGVCVLLGLILFSGRRFVMNKEYELLLLMLVTLMPIIISSMADGFWGVIVPPILIYFIGVRVVKGRYTIYNVSAEMLETTLTAVLGENNIPYEQRKNAIVLKKDKNKSIRYTPSLNTVEINQSEIAGLPENRAIKEEVITRIRKMETRVFPSAGVFLVLLGIAFVFVMRFVERVWL
ncbi:hypothetical protein [Dethiobacter alkaliphilus]|uniref:hypothetical protein n=1 Tax=Dethiobacter alkaliphilus TaxID=427926 RepID=UPI0022275063|nr:hypothetical protein [Dethiobacter alkaliphilus]MCW3489778.1 hypothetical protein [Dethiobacter alkaliphilus]